MTRSVTSEFNPDWVSPPGDTIEDLLSERGWTQAEFAIRTGFTKKHVNDLVRGRAAITPEAAMRLERVLDAPADFWLRRESRYREALQRRRAADRLQDDVPWLDELPIKAMERHGWIRKVSGPAARVQECLNFFGVASVSAWRGQYGRPLAALRASPKFATRAGALAAWLRAGERAASRMEWKPFRLAEYKQALVEARKLTSETDPRVFIPALQQLMAGVGVTVVFVPAPDGCPVSGAARWTTPDRALIVLSLRHKTNDHLWFTFFHEAGHVLLHGKKMLFIDLDGSLTDQAEEEANKFSRDFLIPAGDAKELAELGCRASAVIAFAKRISIAPGIVVGRLQRQGQVPWTHLNKLKVRYTWAAKPSK